MEKGREQEQFNYDFETVFSQKADRLVRDLNIGDFGEQTARYYIYPNTTISELAAEATGGEPQAVYVSKVSYFHEEEGMDIEYSVNFYQDTPSGTMKVNYDVINGALERTTNMIGGNQASNQLNRLIKKNQRDSSDEELLSNLVRQMLQDAHDYQQIIVTPQEDPASFTAVIQMLDELVTEQPY